MALCRCPCHSGSRALATKPLLSDPVAALSACELCAPLHAAALHFGPRQSFPRRPPTPLPSADGYPFEPDDPAHDTDHS